jgi:3-dehydro-L-gulonate 2-dehydrogenase
MASSQIFIALDLSKLSNFSSISSTIDAIIEDYKTSVPIKAQGNVSYPSERVLATRLKNSQQGIPVLENVWKEVNGFFYKDVILKNT